MSVAGRPSIVDEWEGITSTSKGEYRLEEDYSADFGEPICLDDNTGLKSTPILKRRVKSYEASAGSVECIGVSLNIKDDISAWTAEDFALKGSHNRRRDITLLLIGACKVKNMHEATDAEINKTVIPVNGGFNMMTNETNEHALGKTLQKIPYGEAGYIWVNPNYNKANIQS